MRIRERCVIDRPASAVWPFVGDAQSFAAWNEKVASMEVEGPFRLGQRFATHYVFKERPSQFMTEVVRLEEGRVLELRHDHAFGQGLDPRMEVTERVTLKPRGERTLVVKAVVVTHHGMPWWAIPLVWLVTRFGKPVGENRLKTMREGARSARA